MTVTEKNFKPLLIAALMDINRTLKSIDSKLEQKKYKNAFETEMEVFLHGLEGSSNQECNETEEA